MANDSIKLVDVGALDRFKTDIENEIPDSVQYSTMPTASADLVGKIVQYTGEDAPGLGYDLINGHWYKCESWGTGYIWTDLYTDSISNSSKPVVSSAVSSALQTKQNIIQVAEMPTASSTRVGDILQYIGTTTASYTNGYFYKCVPGSTSGTYEWTRINVQPGGGGGGIIDDEHVSTETTYSSSHIEEIFGYINITWENATDEEIVDAIALADAGLFSPANYWAVGDVRTFSLSAINPTTGVDETQPAQDVEMIIVHLGLYKDANDKTVNAIVQLKNVLSTAGRMNTTVINSGSWESCPRRTWCNSNFYNAIASTIRPIFKQFKTVTAKENNSSEITTSIDYFALPAEKELLEWEVNGTAEEAAALTQWDYYKVTANRIKRKDTSAISWWLRSPRKNNTQSFCSISANGGSGANMTNTQLGISPFGCV